MRIATQNIFVATRRDKTSRETFDTLRTIDRTNGIDQYGSVPNRTAFELLLFVLLLSSAKGSAIAFALAFAVVCPFGCHPVGICGFLAVALSAMLPSCLATCWRQHRE
jgi:hypothetical protein